MNSFYFVLFVLFVLMSNSYADILSVPGNFSLIQDAISASSYGDTVLVANGTYQESINFMGKQIIVASNFIFTNNIQDIENTIIDANQEYFHVVSFVTGETLNSKLIGLSITGGNADGSDGTARGGGIYCTNINTSFTIDHCYIYNNTASNAGGGIALEAPSSSVLITNCKIYNNTAAGGGGIYLGSIQEKSFIRDCEIFNNSAEDGGAIINLREQSEVINCSIYDNTASEQATAVLAFAGFKIDRCLIYNNSSDLVNVFHFNFVSTFTEPMLIMNSTIVKNGSELSNTMHLSGNIEMVMVNTILDNEVEHEIFADQSVVNGQIVIAYSNIVNGQESLDISDNCDLIWEDSNVSSNPMFEDPENNNFNLTENSPCIDAGTANYDYNGETILFIDYDEYSGAAPDMGCFEYNVNSSSNFEFIAPDGFQLFNYPNPFNPTTIISYILDIDSDVELSVFNVKGQKVKMLVNTKLSKGKHSVTWNGLNENNRDVSSGIYLYKLKTNNQESVKPMILLK